MYYLISSYWIFRNKKEIKYYVYKGKNINIIKSVIENGTRNEIEDLLRQNSMKVLVGICIIKEHISPYYGRDNRVF